MGDATSGSASNQWGRDQSIAEMQRPKHQNYVSNNFNGTGVQEIGWLCRVWLPISSENPHLGERRGVSDALEPSRILRTVDGFTSFREMFGLCRSLSAKRTNCTANSVVSVFRTIRFRRINSMVDCSAWLNRCQPETTF